jgi:ribulose-phosphate 3-epimerase
MIEIIPAILPEDFSDLEEKLSIISGKVPLVHIDVTNGTLTKQSNWPYSDDASEFLKIVNEVEGFPFWEEVSFEVHLMVKDPTEIIEDWILAGAERIILHIESFDDESELSRVLSVMKNRFDKNSSHLSIEVGLAVNASTPLNKVYPHVLEADFIHLMSIDEIGAQGEPFNEKIFGRIKDLREKFSETIIAVDGGVDIENIEELVDAGANRLVIGSAIFGTENPEQALEDFLEMDTSTSK